MLDDAMVAKYNRLADLRRIHAGRKESKKHEGFGKMADNRVEGTCDVCLAENTKVKNSHGVRACTMCATLQSRVKKHPKLMVEEISRLVGDGFFPLAERVDDGPEVEKLKKILTDVALAMDFNIDIIDLNGLPGMVETRQNLYEMREKTINTIRDDLTQSRKTEELAGGRANKLMSELRASESEIDTLSSNNADLANQLQEVEAERDRLEKEVERLQDDNLDLMSKMTSGSKKSGTDVVEVSRLLADAELLASVNTLADSLRS